MNHCPSPNKRVSGSLAYGSFDPDLLRFAPQTSDTRQPLVAIEEEG